MLYRGYVWLKFFEDAFVLPVADVLSEEVILKWYTEGHCGQRKERLPRADEEVCRMAEERGGG